MIMLVLGVTMIGYMCSTTDDREAVATYLRPLNRKAGIVGAVLLALVLIRW